MIFSDIDGMSKTHSEFCHCGCDLGPLLPALLFYCVGVSGGFVCNPPILAPDGNSSWYTRPILYPRLIREWSVRVAHAHQPHAVRCRGSSCAQRNVEHYQHHRTTNTHPATTMAERRIPAWQRAQAPSTVDSSSLSTEQSTPPPPPTPAEPPTTAQQAPGAEESTTSGSTQAQPPLIEHASKFLQDPSIRDAPRERKVAFLQSKGLSSDEIQTLLGPEPAADMPEDASKLWSQVSAPSCLLSLFEGSTAHAIAESQPLLTAPATTTTPRRPPNNHLPRVPRQTPEATAPHHYPRPRQRRLHHRRPLHSRLRRLKIPHRAHGSQSDGRAARLRHAHPVALGRPERASQQHGLYHP